MRTSRQFRPGGWDPLEDRVVLSSFGLRQPLQRPAMRSWDRVPAESRAFTRPSPMASQQVLQLKLQQQGRMLQAPSPRVMQTPDAVIDQQYASYQADIAQAANLYLTNLEAGAAQSQSVTLTLTAPYAPGSGLFAVDQIDFPAPSATSPIQVAAIVPGVSPRLYQVTGASGDFLTGVQPFNPTSGGFGGEGATDTPLLAGTLLEAQVAFDSAVVSDVANQYLNYVSQRTLTLSRDLVSYFNRLPIRLPRVPGAYHMPRPETAIQLYLANQIAGQGPQLLLQQMLNLPLPTSTGSAVDLYIASASTIISGSQQQVREGVRLLFAGRSVLGVGQSTPAIPSQP